MAEERCPFCSGAILRTDKECPHCHRGLTGKALLAPSVASRPTTVSGGAILLILVAVVAAVAGAASLSNATLGVGLMAAGCLLAIFARIAQAGVHHREAIAALTRSTP